LIEFGYSVGFHGPIAINYLVFQSTDDECHFRKASH
jgi:hypothetical protein